MIQKCFGYFGQVKEQSRDIKWLYSQTKPFFPSLFLLILIDSAVVLLGVSTSIASKWVVDAAVESTASGPDSVGSSLAVYAGIVILMLILGVISSLFTVWVNERYSFSIGRSIFDHILRTNWKNMVSYHSEDLLTRLTSDMNAIAVGVATVIPSMISLAVRILAAFLIMWYFDTLLAVFILILGPLSVVISILLGKRIKYYQVKVQQSEAQYRSFMQESIANLLIVKTYTLEQERSEKLSELYKQRLHWTLKKNNLSVFAGLAIGIVFWIGYFVAFGIGALQLSAGTITFGTLTAFLSLVGQIYTPVITMSRKVPQIAALFASTRRIMEINDLPVEMQKDRKEIPAKIGVEFSGLTFSYLPNHPIVKDAHLTIEPGDMAAFSGQSGVGKTTVIRLLLSLLQPESGEVVFTDNLIFAEKADPLSRWFIAYVPQGNTLFSGTIADNLRIGRPDATKMEMEQALHAAAAWEFVAELPDQWETVIGEKGLGLSEGQAQRIAIARALIRHSPILILDEATSALDEPTELAILQSIQKLFPRPTCIIITHRRSIVKYCNKEIELKNGKLKIVHTNTYSSIEAEY